MTTATAMPLPRPPLRLVHKASRLFKRGPAVILREWRKRKLRADFLRGSSDSGRSVPAEEADPGIVETGQVLRQELLTAYEGKYAASGYRVMMLRPGSITAEIWFGDLAQAMRHAGIDCRVLPVDAPTGDINAAFDAFQPNVFIATEAPEGLRTADLTFIQRYKNDRGCLRMLIPVWHAKAPWGRCTPQQDEWRRGLRRNGLLADAHFSIFEPEFHDRFSRDSIGPAIDYVAVPQACNPFVDFPVHAVKRHDYFLAASMTDERVEVSYRFLRPILGRYSGLWAGPRWGFGTERIPPAEMPLHYAQTRIALSPLVGFVHQYGAELTHRVYAGAACGTFQLTMPTAVTDRFFRPDELVQAASPKEYARLFDHYVYRPLERNAIALAALRRVYGEHTCFHRIDKLVRHWEDWRRRGLF